MERPLDVPDHGLVCDMLWSDPDEVRCKSLIPLQKLYLPAFGLDYSNHLDQT